MQKIPSFSLWKIENPCFFAKILASWWISKDLVHNDYWLCRRRCCCRCSGWFNEGGLGIPRIKSILCWERSLPKSILFVLFCRALDEKIENTRFCFFPEKNLAKPARIILRNFLEFSSKMKNLFEFSWFVFCRLWSSSRKKNISGFRWDQTIIWNSFRNFVVENILVVLVLFFKTEKKIHAKSSSPSIHRSP